MYHSAIDISSFADMQSDGTYHLKILVPSVAAGAIIGKGGETIAQLQKDTTARVKMSKANDFYPGMFLLASLLPRLRSKPWVRIQLHKLYDGFSIL